MNIRNDDTLKVRMDSITLDLMERAREFLHLDKSKFIRHSVRRMAEAVIAEHEQTRFSADDWQQFFQLVENPPEATDRFKKAALKYQEITSEHEI
ncbi:MAG: DUF1778 domain-containing protein [Candidatus Hinthialibacter antarcticus]|nr:DUF1778 domain-containing protein [Candidatus Hinthialibacter antarcticus]